MGKGRQLFGANKKSTHGTIGYHLDARVQCTHHARTTKVLPHGKVVQIWISFGLEESREATWQDKIMPRGPIKEHHMDQLEGCHVAHVSLV